MYVLGNKHCKHKSFYVNIPYHGHKNAKMQANIILDY